MAEVTFAMTAKTELMKAHETMAAVLDGKFSHVPEWKAFRSIDRALLALETEHAAAGNGAQRAVPRHRERIGQPPSYMSLADKALTETGKPITTDNLMTYIAQHRALSGGDAAKAKIVVQSSLSKDKRFRSVPWEGKRAWWYTDRAVPK
jgi:hypothetical protein